MMGLKIIVTKDHIIRSSSFAPDNGAIKFPLEGYGYHSFKVFNIKKTETARAFIHYIGKPGCGLGGGEVKEDATVDISGHTHLEVSGMMAEEDYFTFTLMFNN